MSSSTLLALGRNMNPMTHVSVLCCQQLLDDNVKAMHDSVTEHHFHEIKDPCCKLVKFWFLSQRRPAKATRGH